MSIDISNVNGSNGSTEGHVYRICDSRFRFNDEAFDTPSSEEQKSVETSVEEALAVVGGLNNVKFDREAHIRYILEQINGQNITTHLNASRVWCCFWAVHALRMLGATLPKETAKNLVTFIKSCQNPSGGWGGGPGQLSHLATTYAAVMALVSIDTHEALASIDRRALLNFLHSAKQPNGSFAMHVDGETDVRGAYCAVAVAVTCDLGSEHLFDRVSEWVMRCRTYEGGFGGEPNCEAHGGYTFCAVATLALLQKTHLLDDAALTRWLVQRQMTYEGGFQGRAGKLVDVCYSYWQAAACFVSEAEIREEWHVRARDSGLFNSAALQQYVLAISQVLPQGGFADKPEKKPDIYHTCYALAGLALAQRHTASDKLLASSASFEMRTINPIFNVCSEEMQRAHKYFRSQPLTSIAQ